MQVIPRVYQKLAIKAALNALRDVSRRALVVLATGLGKTLTAAFIAKKFRAKRILFLVHNNFILEHAVHEFRLVFDKKTTIATYNGISKNGAAEAGIVFSTWQTMGKKLTEWERDHFDLIIVDEAHHSEADTYKPTLEYFTGPKLGITATPDRGDEADIRNVFGTEVINVTLEEAIARGWLPRIEYHVITDESLDEEALQKIAAEIREGKKRFTMAEVNKRIFIKKRDEEIARIINGYNEKAVVFCSSISHAERISKSLELAASFHSKKGSGAKDAWVKNQMTLDALKNGTVRRVCAVNAFNEGVNVPSIGLVAFCRVTEVQTIFRQQLGRGLRPGKDKLIVLDFVGNLERIQLVLDMMNKISDLHEQYTPKGEIEREGYTRECFEVSGRGFEFTFSDKVVDLMEVLRHCEREFYSTWQEAGAAAQALGITSSAQYRTAYRGDIRLPCVPRDAYENFPGWTIFLGKTEKVFYGTWQEASGAAQALKIESSAKYQRGAYKGDPRLPFDPVVAYQDFPGWVVFLGKADKDFYETFQKASEAVRALGITTKAEYAERYTEDERLPSSPDGFYENFTNWGDFTGSYRVRISSSSTYPLWREAAQAALALGVKGKKSYGELRSGDPRLPASPLARYPDFPGWKAFLSCE